MTSLRREHALIFIKLLRPLSIPYPCRDTTQICTFWPIQLYIYKVQNSQLSNKWKSPKQRETKDYSLWYLGHNNCFIHWWEELLYDFYHDHSRKVWVYKGVHILGWTGFGITHRGVHELGWTGFVLTCLNFNGLGFSSNPQFHCQNRPEPTYLFMGWVGTMSCVLN